MSQQSNIAVIGAGPGGLAAAMLLAASGCDVTIFEAQARAGGRSRRLAIDDFQFDIGATFFMMPYVMDEIFRAANRHLVNEVEMTRLDPMYRLVFNSGNSVDLEVDALPDQVQMMRQLDAICPGDGQAFERFMQDNRLKLASMDPILRRPIRSMRDLFDRKALGALKHLHPGQTMYKHLSKYFADPRIRLAMGFQSKYLGMSIYECPSLFSILPFIEYEYGVWHPQGGIASTMDAMARISTEMGVKIHLNSPVEQILFNGRRATGVCVDGVNHEFDQVVVNADATWAMKNLIPGSLRKRYSDEKIDRMGYSCSTYMLYLGIRGELPLPHHTICFSEKYQENLADITHHGRLSEEPSMYFCNPSCTDPSMAPVGCASLYCLVPTPNTKSGINWKAEAPRLRRQVIDQLGRRLGISDIESRIIAEHQITPADWQAQNINHGATFNLAHSLKQMLGRRPQHRLQDVDGVWLVGGGTHPGSGLPVILLSSQITTDLICKEVGIPWAGSGSSINSSTSSASQLQDVLVPS